MPSVEVIRVLLGNKLWKKYKLAMGSQHPQVAILVLDDKLDCLGILRKKFVGEKNGPAFYPGPVLPPGTDGWLPIE